MPQITIKHFKSPFGELILGAFDHKLCLCDWQYRKQRTAIDNRISKGLNAEFIVGESEVITETITQLNSYFKGELKQFTIPLLFVGTDFQKQVWKALLTINFGTTESYLGLSKRLNNQKAIRAVGTANGANAISILVPCHRIIGSNGSLVGYAGGLPAKKKLLQLENVILNDQLNLFT